MASTGRAHPRSRGENAVGDPHSRTAYGSSPLTRGKPLGLSGPARHHRLIPAHAGKTASRPPPTSTRPAHPRSRGENQRGCGSTGCDGGSSPLTRGKRRRRQGREPGRRLIPAHAGKTANVSILPSHASAHPRSRGENLLGCLPGVPGMGSSPLTRGKLTMSVWNALVSGLIPAHAGKTAPGETYEGSITAHPRSRGENGIQTAVQTVADGSSPLTRGKRPAPARRGQGHRLIPAHAGKTQLFRGRGGLGPAHPRSRGENRVVPCLFRVGGGSSPLTRGKPDAVDEALDQGRLIPAHAGKTLPDLRFYCADRSDLGNP